MSNKYLGPADRQLIAEKWAAYASVREIAGLVTLNILYILIEVNGESVVELDKMNPTYKVNGVDLLAEYKEMC